MHTHNDYEVIVVGGGPAGSAAALVLARSRRRVLLIDDGNPRNERSQGIHNYLTRDGILPADFRKGCRAELEHYGATLLTAYVVKAETKEGGGFTVTDREGHTYHARKLVIATGVTDNIPDIPGLKELWGCGVYHCPYCDGWELKGQTVGLYARRYNGYGMALALKQLADKVILFTDTARYLKAIERQHLKAAGIDIHTGAITRLSQDHGKLTCVQLANGHSVPCNSMFTHNGIKYNNELLLQLGGRCNKNGAAYIDKRQQCNIPGVYVAGDTVFDMQFVSVAAAEGVKAAVATHNALLQEDKATALATLMPHK